MNSRLEQFIRDHREQFDADEPGKKVWENIRDQMEQGKKQATTPGWSKIVRLNRVRWSVAAAVILLVAGSIWYFTTTQKGQPAMAKNTPPPVDTASKSPAKGTQTDSATGPSLREHPPLASTATNTEAGPEADYKEEMYHYARLVELKHKELKTIEKDEPLLYKQFAGDVNQLDSVYHTLEKQLPKNPNREQLLEAMIQNLQLQMGLLNHQLDIIKKINLSKKTEYEKAYKTI